MKLKLHHKFIGKEKVKAFKKEYKGGIFLYGNHTLDFADTFIPSQIFYPKRNFLIVNSENVSMKGIGWFVEMLGAIPIPTFLRGVKVEGSDGIKATNNFVSAIEKTFNYPVKFDVPSFCFTNTYQKRGKDKFKVVTYIDGPFYTNKELKSKKEMQKDLRNRIYETMVKRSENNTIELIKYIKKEDNV